MIAITDAAPHACRQCGQEVSGHGKHVHLWPKASRKAEEDETSQTEPSPRFTVLCTRCGATLGGGLTSHRKACLRVPKPVELAAIFLSGRYASSEALALHYNVGTKFIEERLLLGGVDGGLIAEAREWKTHAVPRRKYAKCSLCEIYVVPDDEQLPEGWTRAINGLTMGDYVDKVSGRERHGILCPECAGLAPVAQR